MNPQIDWPLLGGQVGLGFIFGFAMGFTLRKVIKLALILLALGLAFALVLDHEHVITIHWQTVQSWYDTTMQQDGGPMHWIKRWGEGLAAMIPVTGSFVVGLIWGLRKG